MSLNQNLDILVNLEFKTIVILNLHKQVLYNYFEFLHPHLDHNMHVLNILRQHSTVFLIYE